MELARDDCRRVGKASRSCKLTPLSSASTCCLLNLMLVQLLLPYSSSLPPLHLERRQPSSCCSNEFRNCACRLFRIFTPRVPCSNATSRRGAAAYGDDNTFLFLAETLERAPLWVSQLVARTFFTQLFVYVTMAHLYRCVSIVHHLTPPTPLFGALHVEACLSVTRHGRRPRTTDGAGRRPAPNHTNTK